MGDHPQNTAGQIKININIYYIYIYLKIYIIYIINIKISKTLNCSFEWSRAVGVAVSGTACVLVPGT